MKCKPLDENRSPVPSGAKLKTHTQKQCPRCGLWTVWQDKKTGETSSECD